MGQRYIERYAALLLLPSLNRYVFESSKLR